MNLFEKFLKPIKTITKNISLFLILVFICSTIGWGQNGGMEASSQNKKLKFRGVAELGYLAVMQHQVQFGENGTYINYVNDGGQDVLFPVSRLSLELEIKNKHTLILLYQPLRLETTTLLENDLLIDGLVFPAGTTVDFLYSFPFYRISYLNELLPENEKFDLAVGASLQIRNATINFESADGSLFRSNRDIGPVPLLKFRSRYHINSKTYTEIEADGFYAPISYLNGSDSDVVGAILDASLRQGLKVTDEVGAFVNVRYLGGGAEGSSGDYVKNWLHFMTVTAGFTYEFSAF